LTTVKMPRRGRNTEYVLLDQVCPGRFFVHPVSSGSRHDDISIAEVSDGQIAAAGQVEARHHSIPLAKALFKSERARAVAEGRPMDTHVAYRGIEQNPFKWDAAAPTKPNVAFCIWTAGRGDQLEHHLTTAAYSALIERGASR
jgi:hypothetical protein